MLVGASGGFLRNLDLIVGGAAGGGAVNVNKALTTEIAVNFLRLCGHNNANIGNVAPAGGKDKAGGHAQFGVYLAQNLKALFPAGCAHADHVVFVHGVRVDGGPLNGDGGSCRPGPGGGQGNKHLTIIVETQKVIGAVRQGGGVAAAIPGGNGNFYGIQQEAGHGDKSLHVLNLYRCGVDFLLVLLGVQDVDENDRGNADKLETGIHGLAKGILCVVRRIAELFHGLGPGVGNDRRVGYAIGVVCQIDGGGTENDLQPCGTQNGGDQAGGLFRYSDAMLKCHLAYSPFSMAAFSDSALLYRV